VLWLRLLWDSIWIVDVFPLLPQLINSPGSLRTQFSVLNICQWTIHNRLKGSSLGRMPIGLNYLRDIGQDQDKRISVEYDYSHQLSKCIFLILKQYCCSTRCWRRLGTNLDGSRNWNQLAPRTTPWIRPRCQNTDLWLRRVRIRIFRQRLTEECLEPGRYVGCYSWKWSQASENRATSHHFYLSRPGRSSR